MGVAFMTEFVKNYCFQLKKCLGSSTYSTFLSDLTPRDYHLFVDFKKHLRWNHFSNNEKMLKTIKNGVFTRQILLLEVENLEAAI